MSGDVRVALLKTVVLLNVVEVVTAQNNGALHLGGDDDTAEDPAADGNVTSEGTLLVDVAATNCSVRRLEAQTNATKVTRDLCVLCDRALSAEVNGGLLLESTLGLQGGVREKKKTRGGKLCSYLANKFSHVVPG